MVNGVSGLNHKCRQHSYRKTNMGTMRVGSEIEILFTWNRFLCILAKLLILGCHTYAHRIESRALKHEKANFYNFKRKETKYCACHH